MPVDENGNECTGECCKINICLNIEDVCWSEEAVTKLKEFFSQACSGDDENGDDD